MAARSATLTLILCPGGRENAIPHSRRETILPKAKREDWGQGSLSADPNLDHYSATALFLACVRRLRPDFQPVDDDARCIAHICRLLDGSPLAIELAAARVRT
jgi:predicted ATPase